MREGSYLESLAVIVAASPGIVGWTGLWLHWNLYTCLSLILGSVVLYATLQVAKR